MGDDGEVTTAVDFVNGGGVAGRGRGGFFCSFFCCGGAECSGGCC